MARTIIRSLSRRSIEDPRHPLTSKVLADLLGGERSDAGVSVTETNAWGIIAYYRAIALLAGTMASLPLHAYLQNSRERMKSPVLARPCPRYTPFEFWELLYAHALGWGNGYARKLTDGNDVVQQLWPIHASRVHVDLVPPDGNNAAGKVFVVTDDDGQQHPFTTREILHVPGMGYDGAVGLSPAKLARQTLGTGIAAEAYAGRFFGNGSMPSGILTSDKSLDETKAEALKERWRSKIAGLGNSHEIAVLDNGAKFEPVSIPPEDAQLLQTRGWTVTEVARLFGVPPHLIGDVERSTSWGTGIEQQSIGFVVYTLRPWLTRVEQRVTAEVLPSRWYAKYTVEGLLRGDSASRSAFYASAIQNGWMHRNEVRELEDREPADGLDEFLAPSNLTLVQVNGDLVPLSGGASSGSNSDG